MTDDADALDRLLAELPTLRVSQRSWERIEELLARLQRSGDGHPARDVSQELSQVVFEARVQRRFHGTRAGADVVPTKQTSVLPWVGLACGALLVAVGALLGGGIILVGIAVLGVFVFGIAFAGSRVAHRGDSSEDDDPAERPVAIPDSVALRVSALRRGG